MPAPQTCSRPAKESVSSAASDPPAFPPGLLICMYAAATETAPPTVLGAKAIRPVVREAARLIAETVQAAKRKAAVVVARVLHGVVQAERIVRVVIIVRMGQQIAGPIAIGSQRSKIVDDGIILTVALSTCRE